MYLTSINAFSQQKKVEFFKPAEAHKRRYNALYVLNEADDKKIRGLLCNINNVLNDPRLKGKLYIEVIAFFLSSARMLSLGMELFNADQQDNDRES